jgi:anti-anti-sigma regulatory factor
MTISTIDPSGDQTKTTIKVEGIVTSADWEALRECCLDALKTNDRVVLDMEEVCQYDFSLTVFVCLLRRTVLLLDKHLTITGRREEFVCLYSKGGHCSNSEAGALCRCESLFDRSAGP